MFNLFNLKKNNNVMYLKTFEDTSTLHAEVKKTISNFILLLYAEVMNQYTDKQTEFALLNKDILDFESKMEYLNILKCYENTLIELRYFIKSLASTHKDITPADAFNIIKEAQEIIEKNIFKPLRDIKSEIGFIHKLKMLFNNVIDKLGLNKIGFTFFSPKPSFNDAKILVKETENIGNAINYHFGVQI